MKKLILLSLLVVQSLCLWAGTVTSLPRNSYLFNFGWKFHLGDVKGAEANDFDDSAWRKLDLPHDYQIEQPWTKKGSSMRGYKPLGIGWYRKTFKADPAWKGKKVLLDFEGIMYLGDVWLNGKPIGSTEYGYLGFESDITSLLDYDKENVVAVRASTGKSRGSRWYTGGGLYRDVHLVVKSPVSVARHGVFVTTPVVSEQKANVNVQVELEGIKNKQYNVEIRAKIFAPDGSQVGETRLAAPQKNKLNTVEIPLPVVEVKQPRLWSCESPALYTVKVEVLKDGQVVDNVAETFGIRTLEYSKDFGFKLNGKKVFLKGVANHQDLGALGVATYDFAIERLFRQLKAFGYNSIRTSHNPYSEAFMRLADKYGFLVVDELIDKWSDNSYWGGRKPFTSLWYTMLPEWVKRDRNHPSVILWSLGNELQMREDLAGFPTGDWGITTYRIFDTLLKRYDPTRKTTVAMFPSRAGGITRHDSDYNVKVLPPELSTVTEIASFNYVYQDYPKYLKACPDMILYQSEESTKNLTTSYYTLDRERMVGMSYWGTVEYWGESGGWPKKGWNYSFFNHALEPYPQAYLMKSAFEEDEPLVHIGVVDGTENVEWNDVVQGRMSVSSHWNREVGSKLNLFTYTNADEVELFVNGKSLGVKKNVRTDPQQRNMLYWKDVPYGNGGNVLAVARTGGREVARHRLETAGEPVALKAVVENSSWKSGGMDLQYIRIYAVDKKGRTVPVSGKEVTFKVEGAATLLAVDNGDHLTNELFTGPAITLHNGFAMGILRSAQVPGSVKVKVLSDGLKGVQLKLKSE